jgi:hypothetical protein
MRAKFTCSLSAAFRADPRHPRLKSSVWKKAIAADLLG